MTRLKIMIHLPLIVLAGIQLVSCAGTGSNTGPQPSASNAGVVVTSADRLRQVAALITSDLTSSLPRKEGLKVAVMPFTEMDGTTVNYLGFYLAEKVNNELVVAAPQIDVLERARIEEVLGELELGKSGLLDDESVQEAGRALGADAIVMGSLAVIGGRDLPGSEIEANVRVISVGLMKAVASSSHSLVPDVAIWDMMDRRMSGKGIQKAASGSSPSLGDGFVDDFKPSIGKYRFSSPSAANPMAKYYFNDDAGRLEIRSADNVGLMISGNLPAPATAGRVVVAFYPTKTFPYSGTLGISVVSTGGDGYRFVFPKSYYDSKMEYLIGGKSQLIWERKGDSFELNQKHTMALEYSPERIVGLFDGVKVFDVRNEHDFTVDTFTIVTSQMDLYIESLEIN